MTKDQIEVLMWADARLAKLEAHEVMSKISEESGKRMLAFERFLILILVPALIIGGVLTLVL